MRIVVLADVHANLAALEAVMEDVDGRDPDAVVVAGDVVNRGPEPAACLERLLERRERDGWRLLKGNHEDFILAEHRGNGSRPPWQDEVYRHSTWTARRLGAHLNDLGRWPDRIDLEGPGGALIRTVHASNRDNRSGLYPRMADHEILDRVDPEPAVFCVGHTHVPFLRRIGGRLIVNAGAVGLPFDRNTAAAYAVLAGQGDSWSAHIIRVPYDRRRTEKAFRATGYADEGGPMIPLILDELHYARPNLRHWHLQYEERVARGEMSVTESVDAYLARRRNQHRG